MRDDSYRTPGLGAADGGLFENDLVLTPPPYRPDGPIDDEALRLAPRSEAPTAPPRKKGIPLGVALAGWAVILGAALGVAYATQPARQLDGQPDLPPPAPPPAATEAELGTPVTASPIASAPAQFTAAPTTAGAVSPSPELKIAETPNPPPLEVKPAPPDPPEPAPLQTAAVAEPKPQPVKTSAAEKPKPAVLKIEKAPAPAKVKPVKLEKVSTDAPAKSGRPLAAKVTDTKDLPRLKARMNRAYAEAVKAGTPKAVLKARQAEWAQLRAKAERKGPAAVAALYRTRAAQLEAIAKKTAARSHGKV